MATWIVITQAQTVRRYRVTADHEPTPFDDPDEEQGWDCIGIDENAEEIVDVRPEGGK